MGQSASQLAQLSIEDLANVPVTTVSRREEPLAQAPAATYVITRQQIVRSGAQTLPDMLRLAPNLFVAQTGGGAWQVAARGLAGSLPSQAFSNKLLVLVDGRSIYTPLFSGVYWDIQDVLPQDVERIEVISGPAGTLWGANAVNGVVNIITRRADQTQGGLVTATGGSEEASLGLRYGGSLGPTASWRVYGHGYRHDGTVTATGAESNDRWNHVQGGFRLDWAPGERDAVSLHGDVLTGRGEASGQVDGSNIVGRWTHSYAGGSTLQVQAFVDREQRGQDRTGGLPLGVTTYDLDVQQSFGAGRHALVVGAGTRATRFRFTNLASIGFNPPSGQLNLVNLYGQDTVSLPGGVRLILGLKMEHDPYSGWSAMPNARLSWSPAADTLVWAAVSRAVRTPTPFDTSVEERIGGVLFIRGAPQFKTEKLTAYEVGLRMQPSQRLSMSANAYYNVYDDLRSIETTPVTLLPLTWGNLLGGHTYGLEAWGNVQAASWWRLGAGLNLISEHFAFAPRASRLVGVSQVGDDPKVQAKLTSAMIFDRISWTAELRHQGALPDPHLPAYTELNSRIAWALNDRLELSLAGFNLLHEAHQEFMAPAASVPRSVVGGLRWRF